MAISDEIMMIRKKALLTQENFAKELHVAFSTVNRWESGKSHPNVTTMNQLKSFCEQNKISFDELQQAWIEETKETKK